MSVCAANGSQCEETAHSGRRAHEPQCGERDTTDVTDLLRDGNTVVQQTKHLAERKHAKVKAFGLLTDTIRLCSLQQ